MFFYLGNSSPSTPYTINSKGQGPAWSNSLFEDNAEFGYGMLLAQKAIRKRLKEKLKQLQHQSKLQQRLRQLVRNTSIHSHVVVTNGDSYR